MPPETGEGNLSSLRSSRYSSMKDLWALSSSNREQLTRKTTKKARICADAVRKLLDVSGRGGQGGNLKQGPSPAAVVPTLQEIPTPGKGDAQRVPSRRLGAEMRSRVASRLCSFTLVNCCL